MWLLAPKLAATRFLGLVMLPMNVYLWVSTPGSASGRRV